MGHVGLQEDKDCHLAVCTPGVHLQEAVRELIDPRSALLPGGLPPSACAGIALFPSGGWLTASTTQGISHHFTLAVRGPGRDSPLQTGGEGGGEVCAMRAEGQPHREWPRRTGAHDYWRTDVRSEGPLAAPIWTEC